MKHKTNPVTAVDRALFDALENGSLEMLGQDKFRLSPKGKEDVEQLMLYSVEALEIFQKLTLRDLKIDASGREAITKVFDVALKQSRQKDLVIQQLMAQLKTLGFKFPDES